MTASVTNIKSRKNRPIAPELYAPVLLSPDEYTLLYVSHNTGTLFSRGVLTVYFRVVEYDDTMIASYYKVALIGSGRGKGFLPAPQSKLVCDFRRLNLGRIGRLDRFPLHWLKDRTVFGEVGTVTADSDQESLDDIVQYSVVRKLLRRV